MNDRTRVLHIQRVTGIGGSERHLLELLPGLQDAGMRVHLCLLCAGSGELMVNEAKRHSIDVTVLPSGGNVSPGTIPRLVRVIQRFKPDLVHTHLIHADVYGQIAARLTATTAVSTVHSTTPLYLQQPFKTASRVSFQLARRVVAISRHVQDFLVAHGLVDRSRIDVVHYGLPAPPVATAEERARLREALALEPEAVAVLVASRLVPFKGHDFLIGAFARACARAPSLRLVIAGDGPLRADLEARAAALLRPAAATFLGFRNDVTGLMAACDIVAFPTLPEFGEGFGLVNLEAMTQGRPVVATSVHSIPEIVSAESGVLVAPGDERSLADALVSLASDAELRNRLGEKGRERARASFSVERMIDGICGVYRSALRLNDGERG